MQQVNFCNCQFFFYFKVVEKGFKHNDTLVRKSAYSAWIALMDNFASDKAVLMSKKRIKLITRPLVVRFYQSIMGPKIHDRPIHILPLDAVFLETFEGPFFKATLIQSFVYRELPIPVATRFVVDTD